VNHHAPSRVDGYRATFSGASGLWGLDGYMAYMALVYEGLEDGPALVLARGIGGGQGCPPAMSILSAMGTRSRWTSGRHLRRASMGRVIVGTATSIAKGGRGAASTCPRFAALNYDVGS
jgi:hypothetical protein